MLRNTPLERENATRAWAALSNSFADGDQRKGSIYDLSTNAPTKNHSRIRAPCVRLARVSRGAHRLAQWTQRRQMSGPRWRSPDLSEPCRPTFFKPAEVAATTAWTGADAVRVARQVQRLHDLGSRPLFEFLSELAGDALILADIKLNLVRYARLSPDVVAALGGRKLIPPIAVVDGDEVADAPEAADLVPEQPVRGAA